MVTISKPGAATLGRMKHIFTRFVRDESGATAVEYGLIGTLIAVAMIVGATAVGTQLNVIFTAVASKVSAAARP